MEDISNRNFVSEDILVDIGLSQNEAKIYLSLLSLGSSTITRIAETCKLHRANVYESVKKLIDRGLVSHIQYEKITIYEAASPESLLYILKDKENKLRSILPQLALKKKFSESKGEAHIFEGVNAFVKILYDFLEYNEPILAYGIPKVAPEMMKTKIPHFHKERLARGIEMKHIYNHNATERIAVLNKMKFTSARFLPAGFDSVVSTNICGDQIVLVLWAKPVTVIQIINKAVADSYRQYFMLLWNAANKMTKKN